MFELTLGKNGQQAKEFLFLGAHCDDIEIGCGGSILRLARVYPQATFHWVVFSSNEQRAAEAKQSANQFLTLVENKNIIIKEFRNSYFPYIGAAIKDYFEILKKETKPDVIFTHHWKDFHQDHRIISDLTWNTFRNHFILEYEIPKYDGGLESPNLFITLDRSKYQKKVQIILDCFPSESVKSWFSRETFYGLMRLRGVECNSDSGYAEAFYNRKLILNLQ